MEKEKVVLLIPALNPDEKLTRLVAELRAEGFERFLIVNDGSKKACLPIFEELRKDGCAVISHYKNYGKGRALKNAFNEIYYAFPDFECVVTLDADGQHAPCDVIKVAEASLANPDKVVLGVREFGKDVPARSKFGNVMTRNVMKLLCGIRVSDTQTGLRGFSKELLIHFLDVSGERYEYEMNVLLETREKGIGILEVPIKTIYIDDNRSSHFNPIKDSIRIYSLFGKYIVASMLSFVVDISLFTLFVALLRDVTYASYVYLATVLARAISSFVNYQINKKGVFKSPDTSGKQAVARIFSYYALVVINVVISAFFVDFLSKEFIWNETVVKILVDSVLFVMNYFIQRDFLFKNKRLPK